MVKDEVIKYLEANIGKLISGGELSKNLNVSRTAIWKAINSLKDEGYNIKSKKNEGYILNTNNNILSKEIIKKNTTAKVFGKEIDILKTVDSTNNYLKLRAQDKAIEGLVAIAEQQTEGKGRKGKSFFSPAGSSIYMSVLLKPKIKISNINLITIIAAISVVEAIYNTTKIQTSIKWVNDVMYNNKKLCGILTEASIEGESGDINYIVLGIGINVKKINFPDDIKNVATSLGNITSIDYNRNELIGQLLTQLENNYNKLFSNNQCELINSYRNYLSMLGNEINVILSDSTYRAKALDIDENAHLIIQLPSGEITKINCGEISIKL